MEDYFIKQFENKYIGDDGAIIGNNFIISKDLFVEDVHFKREWMSLKQITTKAFLVNISDAIAMNAKPKYALVGISLPFDTTKKEIKEIAKASKKVSKKYGFKIIGGDTVASDKLSFSITLLSKTKKPITREGINKNDLVAYTGDLGNCKKDLEKLFNGKKISKKSKFIKPKLRGDFFYKIAKYTTSALDVSDGLFKDLSRLSKINKVGFSFSEYIPKKIGCSGEEYEMLFTFSKKDKKKIEKIAKRMKVKLNIFAKVINGKYKCRCKENHF